MGEETQKIKPFGWSDKLGYMMGDVGCNLVLGLANSYLMVFYTKVLGVLPALIGTVFMLARFVDAFTDMAVGRLTDTHTFKSGDRFRPWIAYGSIPLVISSCLMFNCFLTNAPMTVKVVWLVVTYLLFGSVCYTAVNIPYGAMSVVLTNDPGQRGSLSTWRNVGAQVGGVALGLVIPLMVYVRDENGNSVASGPRFLLVAVALGLLTLLCLFICWKTSVERIHVQDPADSKKENNGTFKVLAECLKDRALMMIFGSGIFIYGATMTFMTFNQYLFLDYFGNTALSGVGSLILFASMMLAAPFASTLGKRFGKKEISVVGTALSVAFYVILFLVRPTSPAFYFVCVFGAYFGLGLVSMIGYALLADCIDNHYLKTGVRTEGTAYAMNSFMRKIAGAICVGMGGWGLSWIGYDELAVVQTPQVQQAIFTLSIGLNVVCFAIALIFMILFPLNKKRVEENAKKMEELNLAGSKEKQEG